MSCDHLRSVPIRRLPHPVEENTIWSILGSVVSTTISVALSLPFLLAFLLVLPACLSVRWILLLIHCNRQGSNGSGPESVRGNDSRWLGTEWRSSVIQAVLVFESKEGFNVEHFRRLLLKRVIPIYPRLTQRLIPLPIFSGVGSCWMEDANFSIDRHVFPGPSFLASEKDLQEYVSKLVVDGLPEDKSPWQLQVIQPFGVNRDTVVILRVHQSVADGTALMRLLCHSLADSQIIEIPERPRHGSLAFCMNVFRACIAGPLTLLLWIFFSEEDCNLLTHRSTWTGSVTVTWSASITLPKVIRIKQVTRSTVNCVLLSALAGALRRLLQGCGVRQPPDVKVAVPMDLRDQISASSVRTKLGNKTSSVIMPLPVAIEGCVPRLWATRKTLDNLRTSADPVILYVATAALTSIGSASFARHLVNFFTDRASLQFSSLPGPTSEILLEGQTLKGIYPILPAQANLGISITTITYADQVFVSVLAERALGPAAELILEYLEDQIEILWKLLLNRRVPGEQENSNFRIREAGRPEPSRIVDSRLNLVQKELTNQSNEAKENDKTGKVNALRAEISELVDEINRRKSMGEVRNKNSEGLGRIPKRTSSCTKCKKQAVKLPPPCHVHQARRPEFPNLSTDADSTESIRTNRKSNQLMKINFRYPEEALKIVRERKETVAGAEKVENGRNQMFQFQKDCVINMAECDFGQFQSKKTTIRKENRRKSMEIHPGSKPESESDGGLPHPKKKIHKDSPEKRKSMKSNILNSKEVYSASKKTRENSREKVQGDSTEGEMEESEECHSDGSIRTKKGTEEEEEIRRSKMVAGTIDENHSKESIAREKLFTQASAHPRGNQTRQDKLDQPNKSEIIGGVLI